MHTPRHVFKDTLEFNRPQRVPRYLWTLPWAEDHYPEMIQRLRREYSPNIVTAPGFYHHELPVTGSPYKRGVFVDPWGCVFENNIDLSRSIDPLAGVVLTKPVYLMTD